jgi:hypothetical protein
MSETLIFIIGSGVFAITTGATLLYGYFAFYERAEKDRSESDTPQIVD